MSRRLPALLVTVLALLSACESPVPPEQHPGDPDPPTSAPLDADALVGRYTAHAFRAEVGAGTIDVIAAGGRIELGLLDDSTTFVVATIPLPDGGELDVTLEGRWYQRDSTVALDLDSAPFLEPMRLRLDGDSLFARTTVDGEAVHVTFRRWPFDDVGFVACPDTTDAARADLDVRIDSIHPDGAFRVWYYSIRNFRTDPVRIQHHGPDRAPISATEIRTDAGAWASHTGALITNVWTVPLGPGECRATLGRTVEAEPGEYRLKVRTENGWAHSPPFLHERD